MSIEVLNEVIAFEKWWKDHSGLHRQSRYDVALAVWMEGMSTRRKLDLARSELNTIATQDDIEMVLDPTWAKRIAEYAIDAISKEGEME